MQIITPDAVTASQLDQAYRLRANVWERISAGKAKFPTGAWNDDYDLVAAHWMVVSCEIVVGAARASIHETLEEVPDAKFYENFGLSVELPTSSINRLVVHKEFSGKGISRTLDLLRLEWIRQQGCRSIVCCCSNYSTCKRLNALIQLGFQTVGRSDGPDDFEEISTALYMRL